MPIRLIKKLTGKLSRSETSKKADRSRAQDKTKQSTTTVWRPGDPVPKVGGSQASQSSKKNPRKRRKPDPRETSPAKEDSAKPKTESAKPKTESAKRRRPRRRKKTTNTDNKQTSPASREQQTSQAVSPAKSQEEKPWKLSDYEVAPVEGKTRFHDLDLPESILHGVHDLGFQHCTPIQARVLKEALEGHNVAGKAQTGTGKTAAFLILIFKQFLQSPPQEKRQSGRPRALILAPTRELVIQIIRDAEDIGKYCGMRSIAVYGGADYDRQERELLKSPVDLIAATPGRLMDFMRKKTVDLRGVDVLVIDEADRMLDMGFIPDVKSIIRATPPKDRRRTLLFSATLTDDVMRLAAQWMPNPHVVEIEPEQVAVDTVKQLVYMVRADEKFKVLYNLLKRPGMGRVLVFANRRDQTDRIAFELKRYGMACEVLSGAVDQKKRMRVLDDFRSGKVMTVVATDVAGRGLHIDSIDHVVNFDLPYEAEDYVHRIGRTGRAGEKGTAVSFACEDESFGIPDIEKYMGEPLSCMYPEDILLAPLPAPKGPAFKRPERSYGGAGHAGSRPRSPRRGPHRR